jgi:hypothetical protein
MPNNFLFILFCLFSFIGFAQPNYNVNVNNTPDPSNLFFHVGGPPSRPVNIVDSSGTLIYSQDFGLKGWAWKVNENNKITFFDRQSKGWFIMDSLQNIVDSVYCQNGYIADNHDFLALNSGNYVVIAYDIRAYASDTVAINGSENQNIEGLIIQELDADHNMIFEWSSFNHFYLSNYPSIMNSLGDNTFDFLHCNAIDIDEDGNFLISNRTISEITKINRTTGEVMWRFGGEQSDFDFINDYPFSKQHCIKSLGGNRYLLFDNGNLSDLYTGGVKRSRAVEYELNFTDFTSTKLWEFVHPDSLFTPSIGSVQRLENGNTLINFGNNQNINRGSVITEVTSNNEIVFELELENGQNVYCANKASWNFDNGTLNLDDDIERINLEKLYIYPNPSDSKFKIDTKQFTNTIVHIQICNIYGQIVFDKKYELVKNEKYIEVNQYFEPGNYIVTCTSGSTITFSKILMTP